MLVIGLTGGIGCGKTTIANFFKQLKVDIIDTDLIARELTKPNNPPLNQIIKHFGKNFLNIDGSLNRPSLRQKIFANKKDRAWLEKLLHPLIRKRMHSDIAQCKSTYCIAVIPLLTETSPDDIINRILVVETEPELQLKRTQKRDQTNTQDIEAIIQAQSKQSERLKIADDVIKNNGNLEDLKKSVKTLHLKYIKFAYKYK